jgi:hypothetical protein
MANLIVPTEVVRKYLAGSFEEISLRVEQAVSREPGRVFGEDGGAIKVVGTFGGYAIVVNSKAQFVKVMYEVANSGEFMIVGVEKLAIPVYDTPEKVRGFLRSEASTVVESFYHGDYDGALERVVQIMRTMDGTAAYSDAQVVANMIEVAQAPREWKVKLGVKSLGETIEVPEYEAKFSKINDGSVPAEKLEGYRAIVAADLKNLTDRMGATKVTVEEAFASLTNLIDTYPELAVEESVAEIKAFINDLSADLIGAQASVTEALTGISSIPALSELYDVLAEGLNRQEVAGRYISLAVANLASAQKN